MEFEIHENTKSLIHYYKEGDNLEGVYIRQEDLDDGSPQGGDVVVITNLKPLEMQLIDANYFECVFNYKKK